MGASRAISELGGRVEPLVVRGPADVTLEAFEEVVWEDRVVRLDPSLLAGIGAAHAAMVEALERGDAVYGVNTGMGYLAGVRLSEAEQEQHQANLLLGRAVGGPPFLDRDEARAVLLARLAGFLSGHAGVTPQLCAFLAARLNDGFVPAIPRTGVGCAGEIIPLAHAFQTFLGVGYLISADGALQAAGEGLAERGVAPYQPTVKEGIALLAGAPGALALALGHRRRVRALARGFLVAAACAIDALRGPLSPYEPAVATLGNDSVMAELLERLGRLLSGSSADRRPRQAPVSFRVVPQVLTHLERTLLQGEEDIRRALTAVTDSPAFVDGRFVTTGNFHAVGLANWMDRLSAALIQAAELAGQRIHRLLDSRFSGLPDQLTPSPGPNGGLVAVQKRVVGALNELRRLAAPTTIGLADTSLGQEDAMSFAFEAAENLRRVEGLVRGVTACELLVCRQCWFLRGGQVAEGLRGYAQSICEAVPPVESDRPLGGDISALERIVTRHLRETS